MICNQWSPPLHIRPLTSQFSFRILSYHNKAVPTQIYIVALSDIGSLFFLFISFVLLHHEIPFWPTLELSQLSFLFIFLWWFSSNMWGARKLFFWLYAHLSEFLARSSNAYQYISIFSYQSIWYRSVIFTN